VTADADQDAPTGDGPRGAAPPLLGGIDVVDLLPVEFGMTGRILADLGATVVRVRDHTGDTPTRWDSRWREGSAAWDIGVETVPGGDARVPALLRDARVVLVLHGTDAATLPVGDNTVRVVVSPFGRTGPRAETATTDIGVGAASGNLWATGDADRAPVRCSAPLSLVHLGPEAALAALVALASGASGDVDVSMAETMTGACLGATAQAILTGDRGQRAGAAIGLTREIWKCRDGWVSFGLRGGPARVPSLRRLAALAAERGDDRLAKVEWDDYRPATATPELLEEMVDVMGRLFAGLTVDELERLSADEAVLVAPILDAPAIAKSRQLASRGFFFSSDGPTAHLPRSFAAVRTARAPWAFLTAGKTAPHDDGTPPPTGDLPWAGTTIVELGSGVAGPLVGRYFTEQGATVVRVESATRPDFLRIYAMGPDNPHGLEGSPLFTWTNAGSLGVSLDLKHPDGRRVLEQLVAKADAVVENFTPEVLRRLGLGYERLAEVNPSVVMLSTSFHGQTGPLRGASGFGALGSALTGFNHLTGWPDREPVGPASTITDSLTPRFAAAVLAAALLQRRRTGDGVHLDVSQVECAVYALSPWLHWCRPSSASGQWRAWGRDANRSPDAVPHGVFPCAGDDRWVAVAVWDDDAWLQLIGLSGVGSDLAADPARRFAQVEDAEAVVAAFTAGRTPDEAVSALRAIGVDAVAIEDYCDVAADPTLGARGHFVHLDHQLLGDTVVERAGYRLPDDHGGFPRSTPTLGRDTEAVLTGMFGMTTAEYAELVEAGALR
jgi:crotonobetainyl-CoA:carnitine CoA-transferase CaiB-like acyl-CoA transferase